MAKAKKKSVKKPRSKRPKSGKKSARRSKSPKRRRSPSRGWSSEARGNALLSRFARMHPVVAAAGSAVASGIPVSEVAAAVNLPVAHVAGAAVASGASIAQVAAAAHLPVPVVVEAANAVASGAPHVEIKQPNPVAALFGAKPQVIVKRSNFLRRGEGRLSAGRSRRRLFDPDLSAANRWHTAMRQKAERQKARDAFLSSAVGKHKVGKFE